MVFYTVIQDLGLIIYSCLKAFLPLPSLEVILIPLIINQPDKWLLYSLLGAVGTSIGGAIGYFIAYRYGRNLINKFAKENEIKAAERLMKRYGILAVFIGGVTPIPDFLLAYLAGISKMPLFPFIISDGLARLLRSLLVGYGVRSLGYIIDIERYGIVFSLITIAWLIIKWGRAQTKLEA